MSTHGISDAELEVIGSELKKGVMTLSYAQ